MKYPESVATAAEYLKKTIPHIVEYQVPANPINYALWYNHVSGHRPELSAALTRLIRLKGTYSGEEAEKLYLQYIVEEKLQDHQQVIDSISQLANGLMTFLEQSATGCQQIDQQLSENLEQLRTASSVAEIHALLAAVINATENIKHSNQQFQQNIAEANQEITSLRKALQETESHAYIDKLTQLYNRRAFDRQLRQLLSTDNMAKNVCLILADVDNFKSLNDNYGHVFGDTVLQGVGEVLQKFCPENAISARYGGEEFAIILPNASLEKAADIADKIRQRIHALRIKIRSQDKVLDSISASFGVAHYKIGETLESFIDRTDQALYRAKNNGRNRVEKY